MLKLIFTRLLITAWLGLIPSIVISAETNTPSKPLETPAIVQEFLSSLPDKPTGKQFYEALDEGLWKVYIAGPNINSELANYLKLAKSGPGLAFSAVALIPSHDPNNANLMADKALDVTVKSTTRWYLLNAAPYVLSMGDVWYVGNGDLDDKSRKFVKHIKELSQKSGKQSVGNSHARNLLSLYDEKKYPKDKNSEIGMAKWHLSAYLLGTMDLKDYELLNKLLDPKQGLVYVNIINALSYETNRDFISELRGKKRDQISKDQEMKVAETAKSWWKKYNTAYPSGNWVPAVISGFKEAGYHIDNTDKSKNNTSALMRALDSKNPIHVYNACRILNHIFNKQFDTERIFLGKKYALGPFDPSSKMEDLQKQLISYWKNELKDK